jgi:lipopolysaccharide export system ATP-binding protein
VPEESSKASLSGLVAKNITRSFNDNLVVKEVSLRVDRGQIVGLIGPNGAGKSTCFGMLSGIIKADAGDVLIDGISVTNLPIHIRARKGLSLLTQENAVFKGLSVLDNLKVASELHQTRQKKQERDGAIDNLLIQFGLKKIAERQGKFLSGGEKRRLELARLLVNAPRYMLLDEPFAGVDPISINEIKSHISSLASDNIGVLITDHNAADILDICNNVYVMKDGAIIFEGDPAAVAADETVKSVYLGS